VRSRNVVVRVSIAFGSRGGSIDQAAPGLVGDEELYRCRHTKRHRPLFHNDVDDVFAVQAPTMPETLLASS